MSSCAELTGLQDQVPSFYISRTRLQFTSYCQAVNLFLARVWENGFSVQFEQKKHHYKAWNF